MKFNINESVKVKLTDLGVQILKDKNRYFSVDSLDENGYCKFQLWELMSIFGDKMWGGSVIPFETDIIIDEGSLH